MDRIFGLYIYPAMAIYYYQYIYRVGQISGIPDTLGRSKNQRHVRDLGLTMVRIIGLKI